MNERELKITKEAFFSGFEACFNTYDAGSSESWMVAMERAWGEYALAMEREERKAREDKEIDEALGLSWEEEQKALEQQKEREGEDVWQVFDRILKEEEERKVRESADRQKLPEALEKHTDALQPGGTAPIFVQKEVRDWQKEHDRLMLEEVAKLSAEAEARRSTHNIRYIDNCIERLEQRIMAAVRKETGGGPMILNTRDILEGVSKTMAEFIEQARKELKAEIAKAAREGIDRHISYFIGADIRTVGIVDGKKFADILEGKA